MFNDMRDWLGFAMTAVSFVRQYVPWVKVKPRRRPRQVERYRSLKIWGIEWVAYDHEDDRRV